jgi:hypothetical protein
MKSKKNKAFAFVMIIIWGALALWNLFTPTRVSSEAENRDLQQFPAYTHRKLLDGGFMNSMNDYLNDQFAARDIWVTAKSLMEYGLGKREINGVYVGRDAMYGHLMPEISDFAEKNIDGINSFADRYGVPTAFMLVPSSASVQPEGLPAFADSWDEEPFIGGVYSQLNSNVTPVDIFSVLRSHRDEYIYYRTDHHWTSYGAWLGYQSLAVAMDIVPRSQAECNVSTLSKSFYGTYQSKTGLYFAEADTLQLYEYGRATAYVATDGPFEVERDSPYFEEFLTKKDKYSYILGQVKPIVNITTDSDSGKRLIVFKDSYSHALIPMLFEDYSEICLVDLRFYSSNDYDADFGFADYDQALFLYSTDTFGHQSDLATLR